MDNLIADMIGDAALVLIVSSLFGHLPGHLTSRLFPRGALPYLNVISQLAVACSGSVLVFRSAFADLGQSDFGHSLILFMGVGGALLTAIASVGKLIPGYLASPPRRPRPRPRPCSP